MALTILLALVLALSLGFLLFLLFRKAPKVLVIDPSSSKDAKAKELKEDILRKRLYRATHGPLMNARDAFLSPFQMFQRAVRTLAGKLKAMERTYAEMRKSGKPVNEEAVRSLLEESQALLYAGKTDEAEKKLIEIISINPKHAEAFEVLGHLYMDTKEYALARETLTHVLKLSPKNASVHASLGEVALMEGDDARAFESFTKAKELSPRNPKYLDYYITTALKLGKRKEAKEALERLKEVNPENQKIAEFSAIL